jgi:hypothetical protein
MKRSRSPDPVEDIGEARDESDADEPENYIIERFYVQLSSLSIVLFGNAKPGRVREYMAPFLLPVLADIVSDYTAYAFTSFGYPNVLLFVVDGQLVCLHNGEACEVVTPFVPRDISDMLDSSVGVWDMRNVHNEIWFERYRYWNEKPNDGVARMITPGISQVPRSWVSSPTHSGKDEPESAAPVFVDEYGYDILDGLEYDVENVMIQNGMIFVRRDETLVIAKPAAGPSDTTTLTLPAELRDSRLDVSIGTGGPLYAVVTVIAHSRECDPVLYRTIPGGLVLWREREDDITVQLARLVYPYGWGYTFRRTRAGCLWFENDVVCLLRGVRSIHSGGHSLLIDHVTLGHQIVSFSFDDDAVRTQLRAIAAKAS